MGRPKLEIPVEPVNASIPAPLMAELTNMWSILPGSPSWRRFIAEILTLGLDQARLQDPDTLIPKNTFDEKMGLQS